MPNNCVPFGDTKGLEWPHCPYANSVCLLYELAQTMGCNIHDTLLTFILTAEEGARLTLQRNREGFTVQVTRAVQKTTVNPVSPPGLWALHPRLEASGRTM